MNIRAGLWLSALVITGAVGSYAINRLAKVDPFSAFRGPEIIAPNATLVEVPDVEIRQWNKGVLAVSAHADSFLVTQNEITTQLVGVTNGHRYGKDPFDFTAHVATWNSAENSLNVSQGAFIRNKDAKLTGFGFAYNSQKETVTSVGDVQGVIAHGKVQGKGITYSLKTGDYSTGPVSWTGAMQTPVAAQADTKPHIWKFKASSSSSHSDVDTFFNAVGTDGDVLVQSPKIIHDTKTDVVTCLGPVKYYSAKANMSCDKATIYRATKKAIFVGHVVMVVKPKDQEKLDPTEAIPAFAPTTPDSVSKSHPPTPAVENPADKQANTDLRSSSTVRKYPALIFADEVTYWYEKGNRHGIATGSPQAQQELPAGRWRMVWAYTALYDGEKDTLTLQCKDPKAPVVMKNSIGDEVFCTEYETSTQDGVDDSTAQNITGSYASDDADLNKAVDQAGAKDQPTAPPKTVVKPKP